VEAVCTSAIRQAVKHDADAIASIAVIL